MEIEKVDPGLKKRPKRRETARDRINPEIKIEKVERDMHPTMEPLSVHHVE